MKDKNHKLPTAENIVIKCYIFKIWGMIFCSTLRVKGENIYKIRYRNIIEGDNSDDNMEKGCGRTVIATVRIKSMKNSQYRKQLYILQSSIF